MLSCFESLTNVKSALNYLKSTLTVNNNCFKMSGLNLIQSYKSGSSSSDSESDNLSDKNSVSINSNKSIKKPSGIRLPVPQSILSWEGVKHHETVVDDPSLHDGRTRSFKHERGNWATLVYIDYPGDDTLRSFLTEVAEEFGALGSLKPFDEFHLSLTKSLILKFHWIESFVDGVRALCQNSDKILLEFSDFRIYCNEERTRTFLGIRCEDRSKSLENLVAGLDKLLGEYRLPPFYEEASFHVSVLWCLGDVEKILDSKLGEINEKLRRSYAEKLTDNYILIDNINCKIGNKMYRFSLK